MIGERNIRRDFLRNNCRCNNDNNFVGNTLSDVDDIRNDSFCNDDSDCPLLRDINVNPNNRRPCCKEALRRSFDVLLCPEIKSFLALNAFQLIGNNFITNPNTTLKSVSICDDSLVTYDDGSNLNTTTLCDIIAVAFTVKNPFNINRFTRAIQRLIPPACPREFCCPVREDCSCNRTKAAFLSNVVGPVNIQINNSKLGAEELSNLNIITVNNEIAWFISPTGRGIFVCLDQLVRMG